MTQFTLDTSTLVEERGDGTLWTNAEGAYWNFQSAYGGWGLALAYSALQKVNTEHRSLATVSATFLKALRAPQYRIEVTTLREGRSASFHRVDIHDPAASDGLVLTAQFTLAKPRASEIEFSRSFPKVKSWDQSSVVPVNPGPEWLKHCEQRIAQGRPFSRQESPDSALWFRDSEDRPFDEKQILLASDAPMPRTFFLDEKPRFSATVAYSLHAMTALDTASQLGVDRVLLETTCPSLSSGRFSQDTVIWAPDGTLLAVSNQIAFY